MFYAIFKYELCLRVYILFIIIYMLVYSYIFKLNNYDRLQEHIGTCTYFFSEKDPVILTWVDVAQQNLHLLQRTNITILMDQTALEREKGDLFLTRCRDETLVRPKTKALKANNFTQLNFKYVDTMLSLICLYFRLTNQFD